MQVTPEQLVDLQMYGLPEWEKDVARTRPSISELERLHGYLREELIQKRTLYSRLQYDQEIS
jgi:hypothetical protein